MDGEASHARAMAARAAPKNPAALFDSALLTGVHGAAPADRAGLVALNALIERSCPPALLSGALLTTSERFAVLVEGPEADVDRVLAALASPGAHPATVLARRERLRGRRRRDWSVVYDGRARFIERAIAAAEREAGERGDRQASVQQLLTIMTELRSLPR